MPTWPATLPQKPSIDGYEETFVDTSIRTQMEVGPAKTRGRISYSVKPTTMTLEALTSAQVDTLETFYKTTLYGGSLEFDWTHPRTGLATSWRFTGPPKITPLGGLLYNASFGLEEMP